MLTKQQIALAGGDFLSVADQHTRTRVTWSIMQDACAYFVIARTGTNSLKRGRK
jgi:hypothetical protein